MVSHAQSLQEIPITDLLCVVEEDKRFPGSLVFQAIDQQTFQHTYADFITRFNVLKDSSLYEQFVANLESDGYDVWIMPSAEEVLEIISEWEKELTIDGLSLINKATGEPSTLHSYQQFALNKAMTPPSPSMEQIYGKDFMFFSAGTGTGKTVMGIAGAQELMNRGEIDLTIVFTLRQVKFDFASAANNFTRLRAKVVEGAKARRAKEYAKDDYDILVMNYEKSRANVDLELLQDVVRGKRVLYVLDECQKVLNENTSRDGLNVLMGTSDRSVIWPMSASIIDGDPERYHRIFDWMKTNPLGTIEQFRKDYVKSQFVKKVPRRAKNGRVFFATETERIWDNSKLEEVRHRVAPWVFTARKTDPGVREYFKGLTFVPVPVEMSKEDQRVYDFIMELAEDDEDEVYGPYYSAMRYTCLGLESHMYAQNPISEFLSQSSDYPLSNKTNNKLERMLEDIESIRSEGNKCLVFTHWTNLSLFRIAEALDKAKISYVKHYGGQTDSENEWAKKRFREDDTVTVLLTSDAGSHGMNCPEAKYVLNYEIPYSYDVLMQRNDRIDRADSWLDGLEARAYYYTDTVEERIWEINNKRRLMAAQVQGTTEELTRAGGESDENMSSKTMKDLIFGKKVA